MLNRKQMLVIYCNNNQAINTHNQMVEVRTLRQQATRQAEVIVVEVIKFMDISRP